MSSLFSVHDVHKSYPGENGEALNVLNGVSFSIQRGEIVAIVGQSGAGKSTLLHILGALDRPTSGTVVFDGEDIFKHNDEELALFRNRSIGFVFQFHHLLPEFNALENVMMPALIRNESPDLAEKRALQLLAQLGLKDRVSHRPNQLSGGEQQRVAVARALTNEPALVLADEPTGNLDQKTSDTLHSEIVHLSREMGQTFVIVTHNPVLADLADRVFTIRDGNIHHEV